MSTINERVKELRKSSAVNLTIEKFGERIGLQKSAVSKIETGRVSVTEQTFNSIVREFNVNPDWLRDGTGTMFKEKTRNELIEEWIGDILTNEPEGYKARLISALASLDKDGWDTIYNLALRMADEIREDKESDPLPGSPESVAAAEAAYEQALGLPPHTDRSALNTTEDTDAKIG